MTETPVNHPIRVALFISGSVLFFAIMNMFVKLAAETGLPVPQILFFRSVIGLLPILFLMAQRRNMDLFKTTRHSGHFVRSFVGFFSMCCFFWSFALLPLANATAIHFASPLILTALAVLLLDEKVGPHRWAAVIIGLCAVLFMLQPAGNGDPIGSLVAMCAAILGAFAMIAVRKLGDTEHALTIAFYFTLYCVFLSGVWTLFVWQTPSLLGLVYMIATGLLGGLGQVWLTYAYAKAPAAFVSVFSYLSIVFVTALDIAVWGHVPPWQVGVGSVIVMGCGMYIVYRETRKRAPLASETMPCTEGEAAPTEADRINPV